MFNNFIKFILSDNYLKCLVKCNRNLVSKIPHYPIICAPETLHKMPYNSKISCTYNSTQNAT